MKTSHYKMYLFILIFSGNIAIAQERDINLMHGMEGNGSMMNAWVRYLENNYYVDAYNNTYSTRGGINVAAENFGNALIDKGPQTIVIAQSMGSLNGRQFHKNNPTAFGGFISTGGPNAGAIIANRIDTKVWTDTRNAIINKGLAGFNAAVSNPITYSLSLISVTPAGLLLSTISDLISSKNYKKLYDEYVKQELDNISTSTFGDEPTKNELKVGSTKINELANYNMDIPMIAVWGDEMYPYFLRNASAKFYNKSKQYPTEVGALKEDLHEKAIGAFKSFNQTIKSTSDVLKFTTLINYFIFDNVSNKAKTSIDFFSGPFQMSMDQLAGNWITETFTTTYTTTCQENNEPESLGNEGGFLEETLSGCFVERTYTYTVTLLEPNDGVVPKSSAIALPGVHPSCVVRAENVNHEEMKNHENVKTIFDRIFDPTRNNDRIYDPRIGKFFILQKR